MPSSKRSGTASVAGSSLSGAGPPAAPGARPARRSAGRGTCTASRRRSRRRARRRRSGRGRSGARRRRRAGRRASWTSGAMPASGGRVPIRFDAPVTATSRVRSESCAATSSTVSSPVAGSKSTQRTARRPRLGGQHPRPDVGVVVQPGDHDLVARAATLGQRAREVVGQLGHAAAEDDAAGIGAEQVGHRRAARAITIASALRSAPVTWPRLAIGDVSASRDRVGDGVRDLRAAGAVEEGRPGRAAPGTAPGPPRRQDGLLPVPSADQQHQLAAHVTGLAQAVRLGDLIQRERLGHRQREAAGLDQRRRSPSARATPARSRGRRSSPRRSPARPDSRRS